MNISRRSLAALAALATTGQLAFSQAFPARPIKLIAPFPPASVPDILARLLAEHVTEILKQPVVVDNKPGAGGMLGSDAAAKAQADGYTLLMGDSGPLAIAPLLYVKVPYATKKDFTGIASIAAVPIVLIVAGNSRFTSLSELVAVAKANPEKIPYASAGIGSIHHLAVEMLSSAAGIKLTHVPYKSNAELAIAVVNGDVQFAFSGIPSVEGLIKEKKLRAIAVSTAQRSSILPDVRTVQEQGFPGYDVSPTIGVVSPVGLPADRRKLLEDAFLTAVKSPKVMARLEAMGMSRKPTTGAEYEVTIAAEMDKFARIVKAAGVQPQ